MEILLRLILMLFWDDGMCADDVRQGEYRFLGELRWLRRFARPRFLAMEGTTARGDPGRSPLVGRNSWRKVRTGTDRTDEASGAIAAAAPEAEAPAGSPGTSQACQIGPVGTVKIEAYDIRR
jgi:hypothetical protein